MAHDPKQLELPGIEPVPDEPTTKSDTSDEGWLELTSAELTLIHSLCATGRDFLRGKLLTNQIPDKQVPVIRDVCVAGDRLIEKLEQVVNTRTH